VNIGSYALARINPGESFMSGPIIVQVPESAPYRVIIEAEIGNTYYHYGKPEQVTAPGMGQSIETTISETAYSAEAEPAQTFYGYAQPVVITGQAINNSDSTPMPNVPVKIGISVKGFDRFYAVTTDSQGNFIYTFNPGANEAGVYNLWAVHPDVTTRSVQATFTIAGLKIDNERVNVRMAKNRTMDIPVKLTNTGGAPLSGLQFEIETSTGITAGVVETGLTSLASGGSATITLRISSSTSASDSGYATLIITTTEGANARFDALITLVTAIPVINTSPSYIDAGMVRGEQKIAEFTITNTGEETLKNARIEGPSTSWMTLTINKEIGEIKPGASTSVGILFRPPDTLSQAVYDDSVVIYSDNHIPYTYHIQVTVTSSAVGNVLFDVLNEFMEDVPNATITFQHQLLTELISTAKTGADGTAMAYDIPEGRYNYTISASGHTPTTGSFVVYPGITTTVPIALQVRLVDVTWSVTPTLIEDQYEITITQTFQTNVPAPVLITEPPHLALPDMQPGQVLSGEFTVTNYGLIAVDNVKLAFPASYQDYDIEVFASAVPKRLGAMQKFTVPYRITKRQQLAMSYEPSALSLELLFEEVRGYGGSGCFLSFPITACGEYVCCPYAAQQTMCRTCTSFTATRSMSCGGSGGGTTGGGGSVWYWSGSGQSQGGVLPPSPGTPIVTEECFGPTPCKSECCGGAGGGDGGGPGGGPGGGGCSGGECHFGSSW